MILYIETITDLPGHFAMAGLFYDFVKKFVEPNCIFLQKVLLLTILAGIAGTKEE